MRFEKLFDQKLKESSIHNGYLNTFYNGSSATVKNVEKLTNLKNLTFKYVDFTDGKLIYTSGSGEFNFQVFSNGKKTMYDVKLAKGSLKSHTGSTVKISAAEYEKIICVAYNMVSNGMEEKEAIKKAGISSFPDKLSKSIPLGIKIVNNAFPKAGGSMYHYGAGSGKITAEWNQYFINTTGKPATASTGTPKTDMFTDKSIDISLKKAGGSQLMSGGQGEALATFEFAYKKLSDELKTKTFNKDWNKLTNYIKDDFIKLAEEKGVTGLKKDIKAGKKSEILSIISKALDGNKDITKSMKKLLKNNKEFKMEIVREAMTGNSKFENEAPKANSIMVFELDGSAKLHTINDKIVSFYANNTSFDISFKSANGRQWTALKAIVKKDYNESLEVKDPLLTIIEQAFSELNENYSEIILEELDEGIKDVLMKVGNGIKNISKKVLDFVINFVLKIFEIIKKVFNSSLSLSMMLLGYELETNSPEIQLSV